MLSSHFSIALPIEGCVCVCINVNSMKTGSWSVLVSFFFVLIKYQRGCIDKNAATA